MPRFQSEEFEHVEALTKALKRTDPTIVDVVVGRQHLIIERAHDAARYLMGAGLQASMKRYRQTGEFVPGEFLLLPPLWDELPPPRRRKNPRR